MWKPHVAAALAFALLLPISAQADITVKVVGVQDGDTLTVLDAANTQHRVRLTGIDAPEKRQPFGQQSKQALSDCAFGKLAIIEGEKFDRYQRRLGKVVVDGEDCNLRQVKLGLAWHYKKYQREQPMLERLRYAQAESRARESLLGLWRDPEPTPPWDFRHP